MLENTVASGSQPAPQNVTTVSNPPQVPGYELLELLGKGGMGEVWKARQLSLGRVVAVKVLPEKFAKDAEFVTRFEKEATALAALSHPNIVQIIDRGQAGEHVLLHDGAGDGHQPAGVDEQPEAAGARRRCASAARWPGPSTTRTSRRSSTAT